MKEDIHQEIEHILSKAKLNIVIFGPNSSGGDLYKKRCQIRDLLNGYGHTATFPEDVWTPSELSSRVLNFPLF